MKKKNLLKNSNLLLKTQKTSFPPAIHSHLSRIRRMKASLKTENTRPVATPKIEDRFFESFFVKKSNPIDSNLDT